MSTFAEDLEEAAGEPITHIVIGDMGWANYGNDERHAPGLARKGELLTWGEARPLLDYEYDTGYGAPDCQAIWAWSFHWVLWVTQYDGATAPDKMPRVPRNDLEPHMPGG